MRPLGGGKAQFSKYSASLIQTELVQEYWLFSDILYTCTCDKH